LRTTLSQADSNFTSNTSPSARYYRYPSFMGVIHDVSFHLNNGNTAWIA
jgi:hypothetical protein